MYKLFKFGVEEPSNTNNEQQTAARVQMFPNPTDGHITITQQERKVFDTATLFDPLGKQVFSSHLDGLVQTLTLPVLPAGTYLLKLTGDNAFHSEKLIVQRY